MEKVKPKRSPLVRLISLLFNPKFWGILLKRFLRLVYPSKYPVIKLFGPAPDASLVGLDGATTYSLRDDYYKKITLPLIVNIGSYN